MIWGYASVARQPASRRLNAQLADDPDSLAGDPYEAGWFVKIKISDESGLANLLDHAAYQKQCDEETTNGE